MTFDYCIGNPPYDAPKSNAKYYPNFYLSGMKIANFVDMIFPSAWQDPKEKNGPHLLNTDAIKKDKQIILIDNKFNAFNGIKGAEYTNIVLWKKDYDNDLDGAQRILTEEKDEKIMVLPTSKNDIPKPKEITDMAALIRNHDSFKSMLSVMSVVRPYGLRTDITDNEEKYGLPPMEMYKKKETDYRLLSKGATRYLPQSYPLPRKTISVDKYKVFIPNAWGNMNDKYIGGAYADIFIGYPLDICSETFLEIGPFNTFNEAYKCAQYLMTRFCRALLFNNKYSLLCAKAWQDVPYFDFAKELNGCSIDDMDDLLIQKYNVPQNIIEYIKENIQGKCEQNIIDRGIAPVDTDTLGKEYANG